VGLGVVFTVEPVNYRGTVLDTFNLDYQRGSDQEDAIRAFSAELSDYHDEIMAIINEQDCQPHDIKGCPFIPPWVSVERKSKSGDPTLIGFRNCRGHVTYWQRRKLGLEWRWSKATKPKP